MRHYMRDVQHAAHHTESRIAALPLPPEHPVAIANAGLRAELLPAEASIPCEELGVFAEQVRLWLRTGLPGMAGCRCCLDDETSAWLVPGTTVFACR